MSDLNNSNNKVSLHDIFNKESAKRLLKHTEKIITDTYSGTDFKKTFLDTSKNIDNDKIHYTLYGTDKSLNTFLNKECIDKYIKLLGTYLFIRTCCKNK